MSDEKKQFDDLDMSLKPLRLVRQQRFEARYAVSTTAPVPYRQESWGTLDKPDDEFNPAPEWKTLEE